MVGNGGMELKVTRVNGGHFSVSHLQVEAKEFVDLGPLQRLLGDGVGPHLCPVDASPP